MRNVWMAAVLVCVVLASGAFAQGTLFTPRSLGMGSAVIGIADDGGAWFQNPAGLAGLNLTAEEPKLRANDIIATYGQADAHSCGLTWSGFEPSTAKGVGAGYCDAGGGHKVLGAGFGLNVPELPLAWGMNFIYDEPGGVLATTTQFDLGLLYRLARANAAPIRAGLVVRDLSNSSGNGLMFDLGIAWPATDRFLVAIDAIDVTNRADNLVNFGTEFRFGEQGEWTLRAGSNDSVMTLGAGYAFPRNSFRLDAAWADTDVNATWTAGVGLTF
jgi:hypothetical protein